MKQAVLITIAYLMSASALAAPKPKPKPTTLPSSATEHVVSPSFECGRYRVWGKLGHNASSDFTLTYRVGEGFPQEILVLGGKPEDFLKKLGTRIGIELYVPRPIHSNHQPFVFFGEFLKSPTPEQLMLAVERIAPEPCGKMDFYRNP